MTYNFLSQYELTRHLKTHTYSNDFMIFFYHCFTTSSWCL